MYEENKTSDELKNNLDQVDGSARRRDICGGEARDLESGW